MRSASPNGGRDDRTCAPLLVRAGSAACAASPPSSGRPRPRAPPTPEAALRDARGDPPPRAHRGPRAGLHRHGRRAGGRRRRRQAGDLDVVRRLHAGRPRRPAPPAQLRLQRRAGQLHDLAAHGRLRPAPGGDGQRRHDRAAAVPAWSTTRTARSTRATWSSSTRRAPATAAPTTPRRCSASTRTPRRSPTSCRSTSPAASRWNSPKFLIGESYGTTRSANLVNVLAQRGIACNGVVLISTALDYATFVDGRRQRSALRALPALAGRGRGLPPRAAAAAGRPARVPGRGAPLRPHRLRRRAGAGRPARRADPRAHRRAAARATPA